MGHLMKTAIAAPLRDSMQPRTERKHLRRQIRVSSGSAIVLGLLEGKLDAAPTTAYLMTFVNGKCAANCGFCPQARGSHGKADMLSRVSWPVFPIESVLNKLGEATEKNKIKRVCLQALNYPEVFADLQSLIRELKQWTSIPVSVSCQPMDIDNLKRLAKAGADRIGIPLDAATEELFDKIKGKSTGGPYVWKKQFELLREAVAVFGKGKVSTHFIVGLGETEKEMIKVVQRCVDMGVLPALFAFTPIEGTALRNMPQPPVQAYRRMQIAQSLVVSGLARAEKMRFDEKGRLADYGTGRQTLRRLIESGEPFRTSGCSDCNRPYYNEKPSGPIYNYPRKLEQGEIEEIRKQISPDGA